MIVHRNMGTMPSKIFAFSTWVTLQSFHGFRDSGLSVCPEVVRSIAALSKKLKMGL